MSKPLPKRPAGPTEPRSYLLPVAAVLSLAFVGVAWPALSAAGEEPEATEPEAPALATLTVRTVPEGATAEAGGVQCTTPCDLELPADQEVSLEIAKEGYRTQSQQVTPTAGMEPLDLELEAGPFVLAVEAPEGATVAIGGRAATDPSAIELEAIEGAVQVRVSRPGFRAFEAEVAADLFEADGERRTHTLTVPELRRVGRRARPAAPAPAAEPAPEPEDDGPLPSNPFS